MVLTYSVYFLYLVLIATGIVMGTLVMKKPDRFCSFLVATIILSSGFMVYGYPVVDEFLVLMIMFGVFLFWQISSSKNNLLINNSGLPGLHSIAFYALTTYFLFQSIRGLIWLEDIRMVRWIIFFIILGCVSFLLSNYRYIDDRNRILKVIFYSTTTYFFLYLMFGVLFELFTTLSRYDLQGYIWTGTTAAVIPLILYLASLMMYIDTSKSRRVAYFRAASLLMIFLCIFYYDSRASQFVIFGWLLFYVFINLLNKKNWFLRLILLSGFVIFYQIWSISFTTSSTNISKLIPYNFDTHEISVPSAIHVQVKDEHRNSDYDRIVIHLAAYNAIQKDLSTMMFGHGWYMARYEMIDEERELRKERNMSLDNLTGTRVTSFQPTGIAALLVDTGFFGMFLFLLNFWLVLIAIIRSKENNKYAISIVYLSFIVWFLIGNPTPILLVWLLLMPKNPLLLMLQKNSDNNVRSY